jgi:exopolysaccharide biosynthesis polyprenyl glycosylphosphotransferase
MKNNTSVIYNVCLIIGDFLALVIAFTVAYILRVTLSHRALSSPVHADTYIGIVASLLPLWILIFALLGLYNARIHEQRFSELGRLFVGSFIGIMLVISYGYVADVTIFPARLVTLYGFGLAFFLVLLFRTAARGIRRELFSYGIGINNVLLVGDTKVTHTLMNAIADTAVTGYRLLGVVGGVKHPLKDSANYPQYRSFADAVGHLRTRSLHTIIQTELYAEPDKNDEIVTYAQEHHIAYRFVPGNSELFVGNIEVDLFKSVPVIAVHQTALVGWGRVVKRLFDLLAGGIALIVALPFMLLIAIAMKLTSRDSVIFKQERLTRFDTKVRIYKFRTQYQKYDGTTPEEAFKQMGQPELAKDYRNNGDYLLDDPRVSPMGRFLRRTSLDELPQLLNVVRGDISLVGPRALVAFELERYAQKNLILSVKSGLTGLAQISGRRDISFEERRALDLYYVQNWSFWNDIVILIKTIWMVVFHRGAF